ncbi:MAG: tetratricopeptide repeat protein, partial [Kouleothrix sp.]
VQLQAADILAHAPNPDFGMLGILHNNIGWALKDGGQFDLAYSEFQQSAKLMAQVYGNQSTEIAYPLSNMGIIRERQGRHDEAIPLNMKALVIETRFRDTMLEPLRWTLQSLSHSWKAKGRIDRAILFAKLAVNAHQEIRQRSSGLDARQAAALANDWRNMYDDLAAMLVSQGRVAEAQHVLDLQKNQELIDFVRGDDSAESKSADTSLLPREARASRNIDAAMQRPMHIAAEIDALTAKQAEGTLGAEETARLAALNQQLDASYSTFVDDVDALLARAEAESAQAQADVASLDLKFAGDRQEMLRQFDVPTALLQAASLGDSLHLFLTTKDISIHREVAISRADLAAKVMAALQAIAGRDAAADAQLAGLYDLLIRPVAADLKDSGARVVMLNLGGFLRYVPFAALKSDHGYLIEDYALVLDTPAAKTRYQAVDRS